MSSQAGIHFGLWTESPIQVQELDPRLLGSHLLHRPYGAGTTYSSVVSVSNINIALHQPGRTWAFLVEFHSQKIESNIVDELFKRIWNPIESNEQILQDAIFGPLMYHIGIDSARCYLEHATVTARTNWALGLRDKYEVN